MSEATSTGTGENMGARKSNGSYEVSELRSKILEIARNATLDPAEKNLRIQALYSEKGKIYDKEISRTEQRHEDEVSEKVSSKEQERLKEYPPCVHYKRNCYMVAKCCNKPFACRLCHDEKVHDHEINRFETDEMICVKCGRKQDVSNHCVNPECSWKETFYFCEVCRFWSDEVEKDVFHCSECGICRRGKKEDYRHCNACKLCLPHSLYADHTCTNAENNCAICGEYLQNSTIEVNLLRCGHSLHSSCYKSALQQNLFYCPLCRKSFLDPSEFAAQAELNDRILSEFQMPEEFQGFTAKIACNDCNQTSETAFHFMGHKCQYCSSFNTIVLSRYKADNTETES